MPLWPEIMSHSYGDWNKMNRLVTLGTLALSFLYCGLSYRARGQNSNIQAEAATQWLVDLKAWRAQHARKLDAPDGWLTLVGLEWLEQGANTIGSAENSNIKLPPEAPAHLCALALKGKRIRLVAPNGGFPEEFKLGGAHALAGELIVSLANPPIMTWHGITLVVLERGGNYALRIKNADSPTRKNFKGLDWYAPDPRFRVTAQWEPYPKPLMEQIPTVIGTIINLPAPGVAHFLLNGRALSLEPVLEDSAGKELFFVLRDATSKTTTYQAARFLRTELPAHGLDRPGDLLLDFNRLENPPCAYTQFATCPLPLERNRLPVAIEAGEKRFPH